MRLLNVRFIALLCVFLIFLTGCGNTKVINGIEYDTYGLLNADNKKNPQIEYEVIWGNVIWGCILSETIIAPVYFFGFSIFEPVGPKLPVKGQVTH